MFLDHKTNFVYSFIKNDAELVIYGWAGWLAGWLAGWAGLGWAWLGWVAGWLAGWADRKS